MRCAAWHPLLALLSLMHHPAQLKFMLQHEADRKPNGGATQARIPREQLKTTPGRLCRSSRREEAGYHRWGAAAQDARDCSSCRHPGADRSHLGGTGDLGAHTGGLNGELEQAGYQVLCCSGDGILGASRSNDAIRVRALVGDLHRRACCGDAQRGRCCATVHLNRAVSTVTFVE